MEILNENKTTKRQAWKLQKFTQIGIMTQLFDFKVQINTSRVTFFNYFRF